MSKKYIIIVGMAALLLLAFLFIDPFQQLKKSEERKPDIHLKVG